MMKKKTSKNYKIVYLLLVFLISSFNILHAQDTTLVNRDSLYLKHPFKDWVNNTKNNIVQTWKGVFKNYNNNTSYVFSSLNLAVQNIDNSNYNSHFNYSLNDFNSNVYKPGYNVGFRIDGYYKEKRPYSFIFSFNKLTTGTNYQTASSLGPIIGSSFTSYKADDHLSTLYFAYHRRFLLPIADKNKYKFYFIAGPSIHWVVSNPSADNSMNNTFAKSFINGDLGLEFDNKSYYTIFVHHKTGKNFFSGNIPIVLNNLEIGMMVKTRDIF
jgi:hypothetical protein